MCSIHAPPFICTEVVVHYFDFRRGTTLPTVLSSDEIAAVCMMTPQVKEAVQSHPGFLLAAFVLSFAILIALYVKRRESPINLILLAAFVSINHY